MGKFRIGASSDNLAANRSKFFNTIRETDYFGWAYKRTLKEILKK